MTDTEDLGELDASDYDLYETARELTSSLTPLQAIIGHINTAHGFREESDHVKASDDVEALRRLQGNALMLIVSEAAEAHEQIRDGHPADYTYFPKRDGIRATPGVDKPEGVPSEIADIVIRCLDFADNFGFDLGAIIAEKVAYNHTRPYKHGRQF